MKKLPNRSLPPWLEILSQTCCLIGLHIWKKKLIIFYYYLGICTVHMIKNRFLTKMQCFLTCRALFSKWLDATRVLSQNGRRYKNVINLVKESTQICTF